MENLWSVCDSHTQDRLGSVSAIINAEIRPHVGICKTGIIGKCIDVIGGNQ